MPVQVFVLQRHVEGLAAHQSFGDALKKTWLHSRHLPLYCSLREAKTKIAVNMKTGGK
jgi:hypothetical protein